MNFKIVTFLSFALLAFTVYIYSFTDIQYFSKEKNINHTQKDFFIKVFDFQIKELELFCYNQLEKGDRSLIFKKKYRQSLIDRNPVFKSIQIFNNNSRNANNQQNGFFYNPQEERLTFVILNNKSKKIVFEFDVEKIIQKLIFINQLQVFYYFKRHNISLFPKKYLDADLILHIQDDYKRIDLKKINEYKKITFRTSINSLNFSWYYIKKINISRIIILGLVINIFFLFVFYFISIKYNKKKIVSRKKKSKQNIEKVIAAINEGQAFFGVKEDNITNLINILNARNLSWRMMLILKRQKTHYIPLETKEIPKKWLKSFCFDYEKDILFTRYLNQGKVVYVYNEPHSPIIQKIFKEDYIAIEELAMIPIKRKKSFLIIALIK